MKGAFMRTRTIVALVLALVAVTARHASLAPKSLPKAELIQDVNKLGENAFCRFDFTFGSDSCPDQFTPLATDVAFIGLEPVNGFALWRTDGTRAGTTLIRDVNSIRIFDPLVAGNGVMFFAALDRSGQFGTELWRSDGTFNGTVMVADLNPGPASSQGPSPQMLNAAGMLYFLASDGVSGFELWKIEAGRSVPGTGLLPRPQLVKDIYPGPGHGAPQAFAFAGSTLFFVAQDPEQGFELWKSDGTSEGTVLVKDVLPGAESSIPYPIVPFGDRVLFSTDLSDDEARSGLWISDGTEAGTLRLESPPFVSNIIVAGHRAFFLSWTDETGPEWGVTDGTVAGTHVIDARPGPEGLGDSYWFAALGNNLIFSPTDGDRPGTAFEPWISDGTVEGTRLLKDIEPGVFSSDAKYFTVVGGLAFFSAFDTAHGAELWVTDGTTEGTRLVKDLNHGPGSAFPRSLRSIRGALYMSADDGVHGFEPWKVTP
jgi:ELWxxDGT repeat protein